MNKPALPNTWPGLLGNPQAYASIADAQTAAVTASAAQHNELWFMQASLQNAFRAPEPVKPHARHKDADWQIHPGADVQRTWRAHGWKPTTRS